MVPSEGPTAFGASMGLNGEVIGNNNCPGLRGRRGADRITVRIRVGVGIGEDAGDCHHTGELPGDPAN